MLVQLVISDTTLSLKKIKKNPAVVGADLRRQGSLHPFSHSRLLTQLQLDGSEQDLPTEGVFRS